MDLVPESNLRPHLQGKVPVCLRRHRRGIMVMMVHRSRACYAPLHLTCGRYSPAKSVRRSDRFFTPDACFCLAAFGWKAAAHYPLLHRHSVFSGGYGRFR